MINLKRFEPSDDFKCLLKNALLLIPIWFFARSLAYPFGWFLLWLFNQSDSGGLVSVVDMTGLIGLPLSGIFFIFLIFVAFGWKGKYWWAAIVSMPLAVLVFVIYGLADSYSMFFIITGFGAGLMGYFGRKLGLVLMKKPRHIRDPIRLVFIVIVLLFIGILLQIQFGNNFWRCNNGKWEAHGFPGLKAPNYSCEK